MAAGRSSTARLLCFPVRAAVGAVNYLRAARFPAPIPTTTHARVIAERRHHPLRGCILSLSLAMQSEMSKTSTVPSSSVSTSHGFPPALESACI